MIYRPDIDGLRALAVAVVVLFHAELGLFQGGYTGVDLFFVISGYLITRLVHEAALAERFSFADFYTRRLRRLFPALLATCLLSALGCVALLAREHLRLFGASLMYTALCASNVYFWLESGYFAEQATLRPLLHTWSLGVEEQFYLVWPALVWFSTKRARPYTPFVVLFIGVVSFVAFVAMAAGDQDASFYLTPFRIWEFALGGVLVWVRDLRLPNPVREALLVGGLGSIVWSALTYTAATFTLEAAWLLLPCIGAACVIAANNPRHAGALLRSPLAVSIGKASYSIYLVHWPVTVLYRYRTFQPLTALDQLIVVTLSVGLGMLLWRYVEEPFRHPERSARMPSSGRFVAACAAGLLFVTALAAYLSSTAGWERDLDQENARVVSYLAEQRRKIDEVAKVGVCYVFGPGKVDAATCLPAADGRPNILIVGDSYAASVFAGMVERYGDRAQLSLLAAASCRPLVEPTTNQNGCPERNALVFDQLDLRVYDMVFLIGALDVDQVHQLREAVAALRRRHARQIVVVGSPHSYSEHVTETFRRFGASEPKSAVMARVGARVESKYLEVDQAMKAANLGAAYVSMIDVLCPSGSPEDCRHALPAGDWPIIYDNGHMTLDGAVWVLGELDKRRPPWAELLVKAHSDT